MNKLNIPQAESTKCYTIEGAKRAINLHSEQQHAVYRLIGGILDNIFPGLFQHI